MEDWKIFGYYIKDIISPSKWWAYIRMITGIAEKERLNKTSCEELCDVETEKLVEQNKELLQKLNSNYNLQIAMRVIKCFECVNKGKCKDCSCDTPEKMLDLNEECSLDKWTHPKDKYTIEDFITEYKQFKNNE